MKTLSDEYPIQNVLRSKKHTHFIEWTKVSTSLHTRLQHESDPTRYDRADDHLSCRHVTHIVYNLEPVLITITRSLPTVDQSSVRYWIHRTCRRKTPTWVCKLVSPRNDIVHPNAWSGKGNIIHKNSSWPMMKSRVRRSLEEVREARGHSTRIKPPWNVWVCAEATCTARDTTDDLASQSPSKAGALASWKSKRGLWLWNWEFWAVSLHSPQLGLVIFFFFLTIQRTSKQKHLPFKWDLTECWRDRVRGASMS